MKLLAKKIAAKSKIRWHLWILFVILLISLLVPLISNDVPLICKNAEGVHYPILNPGYYRQKYSRTNGQTVCDRSVSPLLPYHPTRLDLSHRYKSPDATHPLGTDGLGRDVLSSMLYGLRIALVISLLSCVWSFIVGLIFGGISGYFGNEHLRVHGFELFVYAVSLFLLSFVAIQLIRVYRLSFWILFSLPLIQYGIGYLFRRLVSVQRKKQGFRLPVDDLVMSFIEIFKSLPALFILMIIAGYVQQLDVWTMAFMIGMLSAPGVARIVRGEILKVKSMDYVHRAHLLNMSHWQIFFQQMLPNILPAVAVSLSFVAARAILLESGLSFLGMGLEIGTTSWGALLNDARKHFSAWWLALAPGIAIFGIITFFNSFGKVLAELYRSDQ